MRRQTSISNFFTQKPRVETISHEKNTDIIVDQTIPLSNQQNLNTGMNNLQKETVDPVIIEASSHSPGESLLKPDNNNNDDNFLIEDNNTGINYERIREENIRRNSNFLAQLGLEEISIPNTREKKSTLKRSLKKIESHSPLPKRIQPKRGAKITLVDGVFNSNTDTTLDERSAAKLETEAEAEAEIGIEFETTTEDLTFDDSSVLKYLISVGMEKSDLSSQSLSSSDDNPAVVPTLKPLQTLQSSLLLAVYSLHPHPTIPSLLVAAGKGGIVAVFSIPQSSSNVDEHNPLLEFKAHNRWISAAKFLSQPNHSGEERHLRLITTADDGLVKLWDLSQSNIKADPKLLSSISLHEKGIFAMDECDGRILTGSKDRSVSLSVIHSSGMIQTSHQFHIHDSVVKSVQWKPVCHYNCNEPSQIFASGSQDCSLAVQDVRTSSPSLHMTSAHVGGVHTVCWCTDFSTNGENLGENLLMSAGYDSSVNIYDIRQCSPSHSVPLHTYRGDQSSLQSRRSSITTPSFLSSKYLLIPNEHSSSISIHCTLSGRTLSRGMLEEQPLSIACSNHRAKNGYPRYVFAACKRKGIIIPFTLVSSCE